MSLKFLKTGAESAKLAEKAKAEAEARKAEQGTMFNFFLKNGEEARITFVDGELSKEGNLMPPRYYEHSMMEQGTWGHFYVCPEKTLQETKDKCPLCESGDRPALISLFTVIDHRTYQSRDKTKTYVNTKKLLKAKPPTFEILNKLAQKRGGLAGVTFDVSRSMNGKAPSVGDLFDFVEKKEIDELKKIYLIEKVDPKTNVKTKETNFTPADYEKEIVFRTGDELRKIGYDKPSVTSPATSTEPSGEMPDYSQQL